ncbi:MULTISPECIES: enoyl-CoA hydratase/isomerase family protein [unclassified Rhodococcus (in: high G+C Gram-positive bacteria)]|uniref:enoyl-CoA hydratase/isomerase family protein n=1 Tax=unclassified Rhodococcus (in: high G+C Gram-positive bacteria) TaxID=192944 RepID=UPI00233EF16D|nr:MULTISPECIES: enoyl-CoA hydratase-related protein [unclassified Rhodococcus (in: high G+C Gram-positive bacteria)]MDC3724428.1 enoyl-CoA hydratase/isomerase family protein [Rhodococcus sp. Rp3]WSE22582.1 enoyl-CoA hydratase-related protein [Rhodococcus sp. PD04]
MSDVLVAQDGSVATITLSRPERKNAMTVEAWRSLRETFGALQHDDSVRAVILTGAGGDFCTGADMERRDSTHPLDRMREINATALAVAEFSKPLIAQVEGYAVGAGWNMALLCDVVVASRTAKFSQIFARRGLSVDFGGSWILPRLVGLHQAKRLVMLADIVSAEEAYDLGLVTELVEPDALAGRAAELAAQLAAAPPVAVSMSARMLEQGSSLTLREALENEARSQAVNHATDAPDAMRAFVEKCEPSFTGGWRVPRPVDTSS